LVVLGDVGTAAAQSASAEPSAQSVKSATAHFGKGSDLFKVKKYGPALEEFKASYAAVPSPNSHLYIARCFAAMGQPKAAYLEFDKVIAEAAAKPEKYGQTGDTAKVERDELTPKLALVTVNVTGASDGATLSAGGSDVPRDAWGKPMPFDPGSVEFVLTPPPPGTPARQSLTLAGGDKKDISLSAAAAATGAVAATPDAPKTERAPNKNLRTAAFVAGGVGVVGLGVFAIAGAMTASSYSTLKDNCGSAAGCTSSDISSGKTKQAVANVGLVIGGVGIGAGVVLYVLSRGSSKKVEAAASHLVVAPTYAGYAGSF
jgi:hypothetical protein